MLAVVELVQGEKVQASYKYVIRVFARDICRGASLSIRYRHEATLGRGNPSRLTVDLTVELVCQRCPSSSLRICMSTNGASVLPTFFLLPIAPPLPAHSFASTVHGTTAFDRYRRGSDTSTRSHLSHNMRGL